MEFKIGDKVKMTTSAGSRMVDKYGNLVGGGRGYKKSAILVAIDCRLPTFNLQVKGYLVNDVIVQLYETKELIFTHTRYLEPVDKKIELRYFCDGQDVTDSISDETKRNLCR